MTTKPGSSSTSFTNVTASCSVTSHPGDLEELQSVLHFPEEVALRLTDAEYQLFYQVRIARVLSSPPLVIIFNKPPTLVCPAK